MQKKSCVVMIFLILIDNSKRSHVYVPQWSPASAQRQPLCRYNRSNFYFQLIFFYMNTSLSTFLEISN